MLYFCNFAYMRRLFITDMDGTLLGNDSRVSQLSGEIITELTREGALITVATARTPATVEPLMSGTQTSLPAIVLTGAAMWDREKQSFFDVKNLPTDSLMDLIRAFTRHDVSPFIYTLPDTGPMNVYHGRMMLPQESNFYLDRAHLHLKKFHFLGTLDAARFEGSPVLLLGIAPIDRINALAAELLTWPELSVSFYPDIFNPRIGYIEVFTAGVSKASAVNRLRELADADCLTVYGDNLNDIPMLSIADDPVAVANARPEVKEAAGRIIGPNSASSVALDMRERFWEKN